MNKLLFFFQHAAAHLKRERQRTLFTLFCIAAGVAAVVSLRTLGLMVQDSLSSNLQVANRGDMAISVPSQVNSSDDTSKLDESLLRVRGSPELGAQDISFSRSGLTRIEAWAATHGFETMPAWTNSGPFMRVHKLGDSAAEFAMAFFVDVARYPFYGSAIVIEPHGMALAQALADPHSVAVTENMARKLKLRLGDPISLSGAADSFTVGAIISQKSQASLIDPLSTAFPFIYVPYETGVEAFGKMPNTLYVKMPDGAAVTGMKKDFEAKFPGLVATTSEDLRQVNRQFSDTLTQLATVMGLASLLIGGIGMANTMTVVVNRRMLEIAVLKTIGAQAEHITLMFIVEALVVGLVGSLLGVPLGFALVLVLQRGAENLVGQSLPFAVYPQALGMGTIMGVIVTLVFGFLPTLSAGLVRPNLVLHPDDGPSPRAGQVMSLVVVAALTAIIGVIVGQILGNVLTGILAAYLTVVAMGSALFVLRLLVGAICRLPTLGSVSLQLAQRALDAQKGRAASTLLALVVGIFTLSLIWLLTQGSLQMTVRTTESFLGGNVIVSIQSVEDGQALEKKLARLPGVIGYEHDTVYRANLIAINGNHDMDALVARAKQKASNSPVVGSASETIDAFVNTFTIKVLEADTWPYTIARGSDIAAGSRDQILLETMAFDDVLAWFDLKPGDTLTFRFPGGAKRTAVVSGITAPKNAGVLLTNLVALRQTYGIVPPDFVPRGEQASPSVYVLNVAEDGRNETMAALAEMRGLFMVETEQLQVYAARFAEQYVSLPLIVAALALFASSVIIANSVSLATLERRRQIGIMKAIGLQSEKVLGLLFLENGLVGAAGGLLGVGLAALVVVGSGSLGHASNLPYGAFMLLVALAVVLSLAATLLTAYSAAQERPLNVLRYE